MADMTRPEWVRQAREILTEVFGPQTGGLVVRVSNDAGQTVVYKLPADDLSAVPLPALSPREAEIVRVIGRAALVGKSIARRLGVKYDASLRIILGNLVERGVLVSTSEGYRVARLTESASPAGDPPA